MQHQKIGSPARRGLTLLLACLFCVFGAERALAFGFDDVAREADRLAVQPYRAAPPAPAALAGMSYDQYRAQRFRPPFSTWRGSDTPFELQYFPLGRFFTRPLTMFEVVDGQVRPIQLPQDAFEKGATGGVAGWRLHRWIDNPRRSDEVVAFLGASYFRAVAEGVRYGISARALAIDTVGGGGEEFPAFTTFWIEKPRPGETEVRFFALLESPRVTGAYGFVVKPQGDRTVIDVKARLTLRAPVARMGIAPLTSMFLAGETQPVADDYRPEVHDSDGLQVATGSGEWIWRPLVNPKQVFVTSFSMPAVRGFGLMQRDRAFASYQDLEARYELRPSAWVEPLSDWGPGRVELLQFHTPNETHDNIGAWWFPERLAPPGRPMDFAWRLTIAADQPQPPGARVVQSRFGHGYREQAIPERLQQFHIDFAGPALDGLVKDDDVQAVATGNANVRNLRAIAQPNPVLPGWRVTLDYERVDARQPVELRVFLRRGATTLSETWSHALPPQ
jgi:glucans biosynthesis protein